MKKVMLKCVYKKNFGDDLLIKVICDRYPNTMFYLINDKNGGIIDKPKNLIAIKPFMVIYRFFRKAGHILNRINLYDKKLLNKTDIVVSIAGSIFMQNKVNNEVGEKLNWFNKIKKPYYIIGSNIGPVYTEKYIENIKDTVIKNAKDVCLRDNKSYEYVSECNNVRYAPDIVLNLDCSDYKNIKEEKKVIISVINIDKKASQIVTPNKEKYKKSIHKLIEFFVMNNYIVELFSFCKKEEGDEQAIEEIITESPYKNKIDKYFYNGNIDDALKEMATSSIIVGSRFHANILGILMNKTIIPIIYNDKTRELLSDINYNGKYIDLENIDEFDFDSLTIESLNYKINIDKYIIESEKHFEKLDKILN